MHVVEVWRYPVKSLLGERLEQVTVAAGGVVGDRVWACRDLERDAVSGAKKLPGLTALAARWAGEEVVVRRPDGREAVAGTAEADAAVSAALGRPVRLERFADPGGSDGAPAGFVDALPLLLLTDASLRALAARAPGSVVDVRRFRPSLLVHTDADGFPEQAWVGRQVRVGPVVVEVVAPCPRCVMTTHGFADVPADPAILRTLADHTGSLLGVYARVVRPGTVTVGDPVDVA